MSKKRYDKRYPNCVGIIFVTEGHGVKCDYPHKENEKSQDNIKIIQRLEELEKLVKDHLEGERNIELAVKKLENLVKVMTRKVVNI